MCGGQSGTAVCLIFLEFSWSFLGIVDYGRYEVFRSAHPRRRQGSPSIETAARWRWKEHTRGRQNRIRHNVVHPWRLVCVPYDSSMFPLPTGHKPWSNA
ncbi:hypothetical protein EV127DRAFT_54027 [Xylaria flabelliformis]|nr:hypothetical protein EV127DRAFT_54027 [Xylaria flabelliformis]